MQQTWKFRERTSIILHRAWIALSSELGCMILLVTVINGGRKS